MAAGRFIEVDVSDVIEKVNYLSKALEPEKFNRAIYRTFNETSKKATSIIAKDVVSEYAVKQGWVRAATQAPKLSLGATTTCIIPVSGVRGVIGDIFKASGGRNKRLRKKGKRQKITATIVKGKKSLLPSEMSHQGGNPPFRAKGVIMTRSATQPGADGRRPRGRQDHAGDRRLSGKAA